MIGSTMNPDLLPNTFNKPIGVSSSNLLAVGYSPQARLLRVFFKANTPSGRSDYVYYNVPPETYLSLMAAGSHGKYFHRFILKKFPYQALDLHKPRTSDLVAKAPAELRDFLSKTIGSTRIDEYSADNSSTPTEIAAGASLTFQHSNPSTP